MRDVTEYNEIPELLKQGNSLRLNQLLQQLRQDVLNYLTRTFGLNIKEAEEHAQQAFLGLLEQSLKRLGGFENTYGYIMLSARNSYFAHYKQTNRYVYCDNFELDATTGSLPDEPYLLQETQELVDKCIEEMKPKYKEVLKLYIQMPDLHYRKAAKLLGITGCNLRTIKSRGFEELRKRVEKRSA